MPSWLELASMMTFFNLFLWSMLPFSFVEGISQGFIAPLQYVRRYGVLEGLRDGWRLLIKHLLKWIIFVIFRACIGLASGIVMMIVTLLSCGLVKLPFIGVIVFLPIYIFIRALSLSYLSSLEPDLAVLSGAHSNS
jgi:hypothetical protein